MSTKFWIGVASKEHVENGVKLGICQFCHGKIGPAKRLQKGDFVIYYSSKVSMESNQLYQKFTAIGEVIDDVLYQVDMEATLNHIEGISSTSMLVTLILSHLFLSYHLLKTKPHGVMCLDTAFWKQIKSRSKSLQPLWLEETPVR